MLVSYTLEASMRKRFAVIAILLLAVAVPAHADGILLSFDATLLWNTLRATTGPGMTVTFLETGKQSGFFHSFNNDGVGSGLNPNWDPFTYSHVNGGLSNTIEATADAMHSQLLWNGAPPAGNDRLQAERQRDFQVTGSGVVMLSMDYSWEVERDIDSAALPYPFVLTEGVLDLSMFIFTPGFNQQGAPAVSRLTRAIGSVSNQDTQHGTINVSMPLTSGVYVVRADILTTATLSVPESASVVLVAIGMLALVFLKVRLTFNA
jgi:hypothetical protein